MVAKSYKAQVTWEACQSEFNNTTCVYPRDKTIAQLFEEVVSVFGNKKAISDEQVQFTYSELNDKANCLSHQLRKEGVGPNTYVAIYLDRSLDLIISILAVVKAGGAYVTLDIEEPANRTHLILQDCHPIKILTTTENSISNRLTDKFPEMEELSLMVNLFLKELDENNVENPASVGCATDLISVLYTSGSTGKPKGCMIPHRAVARLVKNTNYITITPNDIFAQVANPAYDILTFEIWGALLNGASLHIIPLSKILTPHQFSEALRKENISIMIISTPILNLLIKNCPEGLDGLQYLIFGGEKADHEIIQILLKRKLKYHLPINIINGYGPAENTAISTAFTIQHRHQIKNAVPIGSPIANSRCYVLDDKLNFVPSGVIGELYLAGDGLALGYLNDEFQTTEKFLWSPWDKKERIYKTGDLVYWLPEVGIVFVERADRQVKIRGRRVELSEIEGCISKCPGVNDAVVLVENKGNDEKGLTAYLTLISETQANYTNLHQYLKDNLPYYMIPTKFIEVSHIPLTNNGKIDRKCLSTLSGRLIEDIIFDKPLNSFEIVIADLCRNLVKTSEIDMTGNFFELGLHSFMLAQLSQSINVELNKRRMTEIGIIDILTYPSIRKLTKYIEDRDKKVETFVTLREVTNKAIHRRHKFHIEVNNAE